MVHIKIPSPEQPRITEELSSTVISANDVADEATFAECAITEAQLPHLNAEKISFDQSRLAKVDFSESRFLRFAALDVLLEECNLANVQMREPSFRRVGFLRNKLTGLRIIDGACKDVEFLDCRMDFSYFQGTKIKQIAFVNCMLRDAEFEDVRFDSVRFADCDLTGASFSSTFFERSVFQRCTMTGLKGIANLRGAAMEVHDLIGLADLLAAELGIEVVELKNDW